MNNLKFCNLNHNVLRNIYSYNNDDEPCEINFNDLHNMVLNKFNEILYDHVWYIYILLATNVFALLLICIILILFCKKPHNFQQPITQNEVLDSVQQMIKTYNDNWKNEEFEFYQNLLKNNP